MSSSYIYLGACPADEPCAQVGDSDYYDKARLESKAYIRQLQRIMVAAGKDHTVFENDFRLMIKSEPHDFGSYYEVVIKVNEANEGSVELAYWLEENLPANWDAAALAVMKSEPASV